MTRTRVLVLGAGPAGLAAGVRLLERGAGDLSVTIAHAGHHLGGKAASYTDQDDHLVEHGWHMVLGFYDRFRALMRRAGRDPTVDLASMGGLSHPWEPSSRTLTNLSSAGGKLGVAMRFLGYEGMPVGDRLHYGRVMAQAFVTAMSGEDLTRHDDLCFRTWAVERGLLPHCTRYSLFRFLREGYFNFPESISAYHTLQTFKLMSSSESAEAFVARGGYSELVWDPIGRYFERLGGTIVPYSMAQRWHYNGRRITGVDLVRPDSRGHEDGEGSWNEKQIPGLEDSRQTFTDFDWVISTIPHAVFITMNRDDDRMWQSSYYRRLLNLRSAATVSMTVHTSRPVMQFPGPVFGLPAPLGIATNMKPYWRDYEKDPNVGAVLSFVGQEAGFESWSDQQIVDFTLDNFSKVPKIGDIRAAGITRVEIHRNRSDFERLLLCEPGVNQFRPGPRTPFSNLLLAGDWIRNDIDLICMEGAIRSGEDAADLLLGSLTS